MTIKQQGGIFGRNPSFNDLEAEQATFNGKVNIQSNRPQIFLYEQDRTDNNARIECSFDNLNISQVDDSNGSPVARLTVEMDTGDVYVNDGNLVIGTSGKGIDFSATSGTGTSELFDDYEEGTWTPIYVSASGSFGSVTYDTAVTGGRYTKVGNLVHIQGGIRTDAITVGTASGGIRLGGLPFTAIASGTGHDGWSTLTVGQAAAFAGDVPSTGSVVAGQSYFELQYRSAANGATIDLAVADLDTGADDNLMRFSATYIAG